MNTSAFIRAAVIAGIVIGLLGSLPLVNFVNCVLCMWVWLGGLLAIYLYRRATPAGPALTQVQGVSLGAVTGLIGALVAFLVLLVVSPLTMSLMKSVFTALQIEVPQQPEGFLGTLMNALIFLVIDLLLYPIFGALAGLIGASLLYKKTTPM